MRVLAGVGVGLAVFAIVAVAHQFAENLQYGVLPRGDGYPLQIVGFWGSWMIGILVAAVAALSVAKVREQRPRFWAALAVGIVIPLMIGTLLAAKAFANPDDPPRAPTIWLIDGASDLLTWALLGAAIMLAIRAGRAHPLPTAPELSNRRDSDVS
jgi:hypothetical protein